MSNISGIIKSIQDIMRKDVGVDGDAQRISQLVWLFFLKIFDDREAELELLEEDYQSPLPERLRWRNWAADPEGMTGDDLAGFINNDLFPSLKEKLVTRGETGQKALVIRTMFEDAYNYMKSGTLIRQVINKICEIDFNNTEDRHTFGSIYEQILKDLQSAGNAGEFYTPRAVTQFIVNQVDPKLEETVLDPACGTGGFLACTIDHKRKHYVELTKEEETLQHSINGVEKKALPHMLCTTNMILHGIDTPTHIKHENTLSRPYKDYSEADRVNVIVTNPPFGGMEEDGIENNFPAHLRTRETADLFMALIVKLLKNNGRAAVVLPDGFLFGEGMKTRLKQELVEKCNLHTIVRLPNGVFNPYTGIKTNILFFTKKPENEHPATPHIWYYEHPYPEGVTSYNKTKPMRFEEFQTEIDWWGDEADGFAKRVETEQAWKVSIEDIKARNYNLDIKNPHIGEQVGHNPEELLAEYEQQQQEIHKLREQLKTILSDALVNASEKDKFEQAWSMLAEYFHTIFTTENSIDQLKQTILQLAVMGKLAPQDPNDEPASELLKKIKKEKERLVKEGKIKKQKPLPPITDKEKPFELPKGWEWVQFGAISEIERGGSPRPIKSYITDQKDGLNWIKISDTDQGGKYIISTAEKIIPDGLHKTRKVYPGDFLLTNSMSFGRPYITKIEGCIHDGWLRISPPESCEKEFLYHMLSSPFIKRSFAKSAAGAVVLNLNSEKVRATVIPIAPIPEQHRIVAKVNELIALCEQLKSMLKNNQNTQLHLADAISEGAIAC